MKDKGGYSATKYKNFIAMKCVDQNTSLKLVLEKCFHPFLSFSLLQPRHSCIFLYNLHIPAYRSHPFPSALQRPRSSANHGSLLRLRFAHRFQLSPSDLKVPCTFVPDFTPISAFWELLNHALHIYQHKSQIYCTSYVHYIYLAMQQCPLLPFASQLNLMGE